MLLTLLVAPSGGLRAQALPCEDGRISSVFIDPHSVFDLSDPDLSDRFRWAYRLANRLHVRTREDVVRRELLFEEGDCYDVERLRDSERLLRELRFIADVDIFGVRQADGSVHVIVDTQDEWSTRIDARGGSGGRLALTGLRLREDNLLGTGQHVSAFYIEDEEEQVYGLAYRTPQLFGSRWDGELELGRTPVGSLIAGAVTYPFVGEIGRVGVRQAARHHDRYFEYFIPAEDGTVAAWYPERRRSIELGAARRWGRRRHNRTMFGAAVAGEWLSYPDDPRYADPEMLGALGELPPDLARDSISSVRAMFLTGQRNVYFIRRRALDTVNGTEDVRLGVEAEVGIGPTIPGLSHDNDIAGELALFAGGELGSAGLGGLDLFVEARRRYDAPPATSEWTDIFGQLRVWSYWRTAPESRHTLVGALSAAGGWHDRVPFQLTLGSYTGLRGYAGHAYPGGRRVVASLEHRSYLGWPLPELFDLGGVVFADVGKIWAGQAPFGVTSPVLADVGVGLRAAFPPGSRQTLRVDVGVPIQAGLSIRDVRLTLAVGQLVGRRAADPRGQLARSMRIRPFSSLFASPDRP